MMRPHRPRIRGRATGLFIPVILGCLAAAPPGADVRLDGHGDPLPPGALVRCGTARHRQDAPIARIVYAPDGRTLATDGDDGAVRLWDARDARLIRRVAVGPAELRDLAFSPDSRTLVVARYGLDRERVGYTIEVADIEVASGVEFVRGPWPEQDNVSAMALSPDHGRVAIGTTGGTIRLRDARDGRVASRFVLGRHPIRRLAFAPSGDRLAALSRNDGHAPREVQVVVLDPRRSDPPRALPDVELGEHLTFSPDGRLLVIADDRLMECRDAATGQELMKDWMLWGDEAAFSADGRLMATANWPTLRLVDVEAGGASLARFEVPTPRPTAWALSPDGATVAASGGSTVLHLWDARTGRDRLPTIEAHSGAVRCLLFSDDGKTLVTGGEDRTIRVWDAATGASRRVLNLAGQPRAMDLSPDGRTLVAGAEDNGWIFVWDLAAVGKPTVLAERYNAEPFPLAVRYSGRDQTILAALSDGRLLEWDRKGGTPRARKPPRYVGDAGWLPLEDAWICRSGTFYAGGARLAAVRRKTGLLAVDLGDGREVGKIDGATIVAASRDGRTLAVAVQRDDPYPRRASYRHGDPAPRRPPADPDPEGPAIVLIDGETGQERRRIPAPRTSVWGLAFAPDGKTLAATCGPVGGPGQIRLYQVATGLLSRTIAAPAIAGPCLAYAPDGSRLAVALADTSVVLWDPRTGP